MNRYPNWKAVWYRVAGWLVLSALLSGSSPGTATATQIPGGLFGPEDFVRQRGRPSSIARTFSVTNPSGPTTLCIFNGGLPSNSGGRLRHFRVASAEVVLNKVRVLQPRDFTPRTRHLARLVTLQGSNTLTVTLHSQPGSGLTLWIVRG